MIRLIAPLVLLVFAACDGTRKPGPHAGERVLWTVDSLEKTFTSCTDDADFRSSLEAVKLEPGSYIAYEVDDDGKTARTLKCTQLDESFCVDDTENPLVFSTVNDHLIFTQSVTRPIEYTDGSTSACELNLTANWDLHDKGELLTATLTFLYGLSGSPEECPAIEAQTEAASGNGEGVDGCSVDIIMNGSLP